MTHPALFDRHHPDTVRATLMQAGLVSPHAFIREINAEYDLRIHVDGLLATAPQDDLGVCVGSGEDERWVLMERLDWDSRFFERGMARLHAVVPPAGKTALRGDSTADIRAVRAAVHQAEGQGIDYVFCTAPTTDLALVRALCGSGFDLIETRCHYHMALVEPPLVRYPTRLATPADVPSLARASAQMVNPFDRFHADPAISPEAADRLMERWVEASINEAFADATVVPDEPAPEAFCTAKYHRRHWDGWGLRLAQPVLSAVAPRHRGWYVKIISELNEHLRSIGAEHAFLITQITNNAVIRCWEKLGYRFGKGEYVFRHVSK